MKIVVGYIDTAEGNAALDAAIAEVRLRGGSLIVINSLLGGSHESSEEYIAVSEAMERVSARLDDEGIEYETHEFVRGNHPFEDILLSVKDFGAELVVIGIRSRTTAETLLLGSTALNVLSHSPVPVLCVNPSV